MHRLQTWKQTVLGLGSGSATDQLCDLAQVN